jgi:hypothetical protein
MSRMAEPIGLEVGGASGRGSQGVKCDTSGRVGVEITHTISPKDHSIGMKVVHRETKRVKFD